jgi:hypothetical protein
LSYSKQMSDNTKLVILCVCVCVIILIGIGAYFYLNRDIDCVTSEWSSCVNDIQTRAIQTKKQGNGKDCGSLTKSCSTPPPAQPSPPPAQPSPPPPPSKLPKSLYFSNISFSGYWDSSIGNNTLDTNLSTNFNPKEDPYYLSHDFTQKATINRIIIYAGYKRSPDWASLKLTLTTANPLTADTVIDNVLTSNLVTYTKEIITEPANVSTATATDFYTKTTIVFKTPISVYEKDYMRFDFTGYAPIKEIEYYGYL